MYKVPEEWKLSDFLELSNDEKLKWLYNGVKNGGGGGGGVLIVSTTFDSDESTYTMNKTYAEIRDAYMAGSKVIVEMSFELTSGGSEEVYTLHLNVVQLSDSYYTAGQNYGGFYVGCAGLWYDDMNTLNTYGFFAESDADYPVLNY